MFYYDCVNDFTKYALSAMFWFGFLFNVPVNTFQSFWDKAAASWVFTCTLGTLKCLAQGHYTAVVGSFAPESEAQPLSYRGPLSAMCGGRNFKIRYLREKIGIYNLFHFHRQYMINTICKSSNPFQSAKKADDKITSAKLKKQYKLYYVAKSKTSKHCR